MSWVDSDGAGALAVSFGPELTSPPSLSSVSGILSDLLTRRSDTTRLSIRVPNEKKIHPDFFNGFHHQWVCND